MTEAGDVRICAVGEKNRLMLAGGKDDTFTIKERNVGIGTTKPENENGFTRVLDILGTGNTKLSVRTQNIDARLLSHESGFWGALPGMIIGTSSAHPLSFVTCANSRMIIDINGNVGIGKADPSEKLEVNGNVKINGRVIQDEWIPAKLENRWVSSKNYAPPGYFRDSNGIVHLRGIAMNGDQDKSVFVLQPDFRPEYKVIQPVHTQPVDFTVDARSAACTISPEGEVKLHRGGYEHGCSLLTLDGITFRTKMP